VKGEDASCNRYIYGITIHKDCDENELALGNEYRSFTHALILGKVVIWKVHQSLKLRYKHNEQSAQAPFSNCNAREINVHWVTLPKLWDRYVLFGTTTFAW